MSEPAGIIDQHPLGVSVFLHLYPGMILLVGFILIGPVVSGAGMPSLLAVIIIDAFVILPLMLGTLWYARRRAQRRNAPITVIGYREKLRWPVFILYVLATLTWAILAFVVLAPASEALRASVFSGLPEWFDLGHYVVSPESYSANVVLMTWFLALLITSIAAPVVEELYFRGFLLPRIDRYGAWAPLINVVLFSVYHMWSLWLAPTRSVALLPLIYVVWFKRCIYIAIVVHVALNVVGDSLLTIPAVFG